MENQIRLAFKILKIFLLKFLLETCFNISHFNLFIRVRSPFCVCVFWGYYPANLGEGTKETISRLLELKRIFWEYTQSSWNNSLKDKLILHDCSEDRWVGGGHLHPQSPLLACQRVQYLRHLSSWHFFFSLVLPHGIPPFLALRLTIRFRTIVPLPHVLEHSDHGLNSVIMQSMTGRSI